MDLEKKRRIENEWFREFELNDDQLEQLIENKLVRASEYRKAYKVREQRAEELL